MTLLVPASGPVGGNTVVNVTGSDFQEGVSVVFGQSKATQVTFNRSKNLRVITPPGNEGPVDVTFLTPDGLGVTVPNAFVYVVPTKPAPQVFGAVPSWGPEKGGTTILITGKNFSSKGMLCIGYQPGGQFTFLNTSVVSGTTPLGKPGPVTVSYVADDDQEASLANGFAYIPAPSIGSLSPELGPVAGGTDVTIIGQNFQPGLTVWFGKTEAVGATVENSLIVHAKSPMAAVGETVSVKVVNPDDQSSTLPDSFIYLPEGGVPPTITSLEPSSGPEIRDPQVTLTGTELGEPDTLLLGQTTVSSFVSATNT